MTSPFDPSRFDTFSIRSHPQREFIQQVLAATFDSVNPYQAVKKYLQKNPLPIAKKIFAFGLGKAAVAMTQALADEISLTDSLVITKYALSDTSARLSASLEPATVILGNHPIPGELSLGAGKAARQFLAQLTEDDLLICLISGGGSALMTAPLIPLSDLQKLTSALLECGASIDEINTLRRHLDSLKGGGLAALANGAQIISLILSDVVGDSLETIASGPTAPDGTTTKDAIAILEKYQLENKIPDSIIPSFRETLKSDNPIFMNVKNVLVANNQTALEFARSQIGLLNDNFQVKIMNGHLQGEAKEVGKQIVNWFKEELKVIPRPFCLLAGGETTVTIKGNGKGGRNQELALSIVESLSNIKDIVLISIATDGEDGPTDAAGAVVTGESYQRTKILDLDISDYKSGNNSYHFFEKLDDLIKTGPSGTNVNDLVFCFAF